MIRTWAFTVFLLLSFSGVSLSAAKYQLLPGNPDKISEFSSDIMVTPVVYPARPELNKTDEFSISFWCRLEKYAKLGNKQLESGLFSRDWSEHIVVDLAGGINVRMINAGGHEIGIVAKELLVPSEWNHVCFVYSVKENRFALYLNGVKVAQSAIAVEPGRPVDSVPVSIGSSPGGWNRLDGAISSAYFYDEPLTEEQIKLLASQPPSGVKVKSREPMKICAWPAFSDIPLTPEMAVAYDKMPKDVALALTPGEYESAAFIVKNYSPVSDLRFEISPLTTEQGTVFAEDNIKLRVVKCWYQAGTAWYSINPNMAVRKLVPELLLNDESLVRVDSLAMDQSVRLSFPDKTLYMPVVCPNTLPHMDRWSAVWPNEKYPIRDADTLQPFHLSPDKWQEMFLSVHADEQQQPGKYHGAITVFDGTFKLGEIPLYITVLPFKLAAPTTYYDKSKTFTPSIYYISRFDPSTGGDLALKYKDETQYRAELKNLVEHGITSPMCNQLLKILPWNEELFRRTLRMWVESGLSTKPLYLWSPCANLARDFDASPESLKYIREKVTEILGIVEEELGHRDVYFYGVDESDSSRQVELWKAIVEAGGKVFCSDLSVDRTSSSLPGNLFKLAIYSGYPNKAVAAARHEKDGLLWCYGNPQGGVENPDIFRRNYGLLLWKSDYDGFATYCYYESYGFPWDDFSGSMRDHNLVYPTVNGVVDTVAWEGFREAVDDIRYACTLRQAIDAAEKRGNTELAKRAREYLDGCDPENGDLDQIRRDMIDFIIKLQP